MADCYYSNKDVVERKGAVLLSTEVIVTVYPVAERVADVAYGCFVSILAAANIIGFLTCIRASYDLVVFARRVKPFIPKVGRMIGAGCLGVLFAATFGTANLINEGACVIFLEYRRFKRNPFRCIDAAGRGNRVQRLAMRLIAPLIPYTGSI